MVDVEGLYDLAHTLQFLEDIGFVHGDINSKNILYTNSGYKLVDYEPDLYQLKNGLKEMRVTVPYIALRDKESGTITSLTDKIGFCYFLMRITGKFTPKDIVDLSKHYNHYKYLNSNEDTLSDMCYLSMIDRYL